MGAPNLGRRTVVAPAYPVNIFFVRPCLSASAPELTGVAWQQASRPLRARTGIDGEGTLAGRAPSVKAYLVGTRRRAEAECSPQERVMDLSANFPLEIVAHDRS